MAIEKEMSTSHYLKLGLSELYFFTSMRCLPFISKRSRTIIVTEPTTYTTIMVQSKKNSLHIDLVFWNTISKISIIKSRSVFLRGVLRFNLKSYKTDKFCHFCQYFKKIKKDNKTDHDQVTISDQNFLL